MARDTKYTFNNEQYGKAPLVLAIVKDYVEAKSPTLSELLEIFPKSIQGSRGVIITADEFAEKTEQNKDKRFYNTPDKLLVTSDGVTVFVCTQWSSTENRKNFDNFLETASNLGYEISEVNKVMKSIKELYEEYSLDPNDAWIKRYKSVCNQLGECKGRSSSEYDSALIELIWKTSDNGVSGVAPGFIYDDEYPKLLEDLPRILSSIVEKPDADTYKDVSAWARKAKADGKFKTIKKGVINRVFASAAPEIYSTVLNIKDLKALASRLNSQYGMKIEESGSWIVINQSLVAEIKAQGLQDEDIYYVNTFIWKLYDMFVQNKERHKEEVDNPNDEVSDTKVAKNVIFYGPPGTGKTFKLQNILNEQYTDNAVIQDHSLWLIEQIDNLNWLEILLLVLLDLKKPVKVAEICSHEFYQVKARLNNRTANLAQTAWSALQSHTVVNSKTVKYEKRIEPLFFDKNEKSLWYIAEPESEQLEEYIVLLTSFKEGPKQAETIKRFEFVTFHQSYGYEEFIEGLRPITNDNGDISYEVKPGVFKRLCKRAEADPDHQYALVIDEINRGNISKIFGELISLIEVDKREGCLHELSVTLPYSGLPFSVPRNVDIIGSMNTADRSLTHIDVALRRRFEFKELRTNYSLIESDVEGINIRYMLYAMNQRIELLLDREHILGHALLMKVKTLTGLESAFKSSIMPLLEEYFFEDWGQINQVLNGNGFIKEQQDARSTWLGSEDEYAAKSYKINFNALNDEKEYQHIYANIDPKAFAECDEK
jgi:5-methylcytosine-specific restriction protein B